MADGKIEIETGINTEGAEKGLAGLVNRLKNVGNSSTMNGLSKIGTTVTGLGVAFKGVSTVVNSVKAQIKDLAETYKVQAQARKHNLHKRQKIILIFYHQALQN